MSLQHNMATIEIDNEDNNDNNNDNIEKKENKEVNEVGSTKCELKRLTITRKKIADLTENERNQLIKDAQNGLENDYYTVKMCKNGSTRICLKKQSKAQQILTEAKENQPIPTTSKRYYTDNQLLMEHIINLETSFNNLKTKHKKLKKRYNELEGYLYADDVRAEDEHPLKEVKPEREQKQEPEHKQEEQLEREQQHQQPIQQPVRYRYIRSWREINSNQ